MSRPPNRRDTVPHGHRQHRYSSRPGLLASSPSSRVAHPLVIRSPSASTASTLLQFQTAATRTLIPRKCRVPQCPNKSCHLISHRLYEPRRRHQPQRPRAASAGTSGPKHAEYKPSIGREGVDGLPHLPIENRLDPGLRELFHHFFDSVFDNLASTFRGPMAAIPNYKSRMLQVALTNQAYCMALITQAQTHQASARGAFEETRYSLELYTKMISAFRNQLVATHSDPQPAQIELTLLILCMLLSYDSIHGRFRSIQMNWAGLRQLVRLRGGIHYLTVALPYVVHVDRACATMAGLPPTYVGPVLRIQQLPPPPWSKYGSGFAKAKQCVPQIFTFRVLDHCLDTCGLLELYEASATGSKSQSRQVHILSNHEYLYYRRDRVDEEFAVLHSELFQQDTPDRCILLATRIVEYPVTWANYVPTLTIHLCTELCKALQRQDILHDWSAHLDVFIWILFAMAVSPWPFDGRDWVVAHLGEMLDAKYGPEPRLDTWKLDEIENLKSFLWSDHYAKRCNELFRELEVGPVVQVIDDAAEESKPAQDLEPSP